VMCLEAYPYCRDLECEKKGYSLDDHQ
jgi:hypothetical protein